MEKYQKSLGCETILMKQGYSGTSSLRLVDIASLEGQDL